MEISPNELVYTGSLYNPNKYGRVTWTVAKSPRPTASTPPPATPPVVAVPKTEKLFEIKKLNA